MDRDAKLARLRVHLRLIDADVDTVVDRHREHIQCRPGCGDCCHQTFRVSTLEGELLADGVLALPEPTRAEILRRAADYVPDRRMPCPALGADARCLVYDARPRLCRKYGIPLWHPDRPDEVTTCALNFRGVVDVDPEVILEPQAQWARDWIRVREATGLVHGEGATIAEHLRAAAEAHARTP